MDIEFELKLEVPARSLKSVQAAVARLRGTPKVLRATYYDTASGTLRDAGVVLRVRREGDDWVQAVKTRGSGPLQRNEHEARLPVRGRAAPLPRPELHARSAAGRQLMKALEGTVSLPTWVPLFSTDVQRVAKTVDEHGSKVEIAWDHGRIEAGGETLVLREVEFELKDGDPAAAVGVAKRWLVAHGLWLNAVSKFEKGLRLSSGIDVGDAVTAGDVDAPSHASLGELTRAALASCVEQVIRNASEIASGHARNEHVHQLRVGIRRTRTALRELSPHAVSASAQEALVTTFRALGVRRDIDHVLGQVDPAVRAAGGFPTAGEPPHAKGPAPAALVRAPEFQCALLELVAAAHAPAREDGGKAREALAKKLRRLDRKVMKDGQRFGDLDAARRHRVRKRLKRLRYLAEFSTPLFAEHAEAKWLEAVKPAQDALGLYNDDQVALAWYRKRAAHDPVASFAVGWLTAREPMRAEDCTRAIARLAKAPTFFAR